MNSIRATREEMRLTGPVFRTPAMQEIKIPFGLDKNSGSIKEVGDVSRGRTCGCVCLCCRQSLVAKQGDVLVWHFSHDKDAVDRPVRECEISFESSCRLYVIDLALGGRIEGLRTPARSVRVHGVLRSVSEPKGFLDVEYLPSTRYDLEARIGGGSIAIFLKYSTRSLPPTPENPRQGLLAIDIEHIRSLYATSASGPGVLRTLITEVLTGDNTAKEWLYHPREQAVIDAAPPSNAGSLPPAAELTPQNTHVDRTHTPPPNRRGHFTCLGCRHTWSGLEYTDRKCAKCKESMLSKFTPECDG